MSLGFKTQLDLSQKKCDDDFVAGCLVSGPGARANDKCNVVFLPRLTSFRLPRLQTSEIPPSCCIWYN